MKVRVRDLPIEPDNNYQGLTCEEWNALHRGEIVDIKMNEHIKKYVEKVKEDKDGDSK